jgi:hypothetical protein
MKYLRIVSGVAASLMLVAGTAAADRTMVVLLDATGSMQTIRPNPDPTILVSRFAQAKIDAAKRVNDANNETDGLSGVAVYKFFGTSAVLETPAGFVTPGQAQIAIQNATVTDDVTPLATAMCQVIQVARDSGSAATTKRFLEVYTDGAENNSTVECAGPFSMILHTQPFDSLPVPSWQNLVWNKSQNPPPIVQIDPTLYHDVSFAFARSRFIDPEAAKLAALGRSQASGFAAALADGPVTDLEFFTELAAGTGGNFTEVQDDAPVPVVGDLDGDFDVDRNDAIILARRFGAPATHAFDLNDDGKIGFGDYALLLPKFGEGSGTPAPDPYTPSPAINCFGSTVTLDGKVIENGGITINTTGACRVIIKNSLIVSGAAAIKVLGTAIFEIDNSIIVGEAQWLNSTGASVVSAANTVFHGPRKLIGAFVLLDRGGNTFEQ